jgi:hypothetical protein
MYCTKCAIPFDRKSIKQFWSEIRQNFGGEKIRELIIRQFFREFTTHTLKGLAPWTNISEEDQILLAVAEILSILSPCYFI